MTKYAVNWDNGNNACGTFPQRFRTAEQAEAFAENWMNERNLEDLGLTPEMVAGCGGEGCYTAEAIEFEEEDLDPESAPDQIRGSPIGFLSNKTSPERCYL